MDNYYDRIRKSIEVGEEADYQQDCLNLLGEIAEKDKRIKELEEERDEWEKISRLMNTSLQKTVERVEELEKQALTLKRQCARDLAKQQYNDLQLLQCRDEIIMKLEKRIAELEALETRMVRKAIAKAEGGAA